MDQRLFEYFLDVGEDESIGDVVELGAYLGKSAAHIGAFVRPGERFIVCDLFDSAYRGLSREAFERNYRAIRGDLPTVLQAPSAAIVHHVEKGGARFIHVDASHLFEHVTVDLDSAESLLREDGVVVFDDYRTVHTPGVAAAVWGAVSAARLAPVCLTPQKFYGVFGDPSRRSEEMMRWLADKPRIKWEVLRVGDHDLIRILPPTVAPTTEAARKPQRTDGQVLRRVDKRLKRVESQLVQLSAPSRLQRAAGKLHRGRGRKDDVAATPE